MSRSASLAHVGAFLVSIAALGALISVLALPWVDLPWWKVFRRSVSIAAAPSVWLLARVTGRSVRSYGLTGWREGRRELVAGVGLGLAVLAGFFSLLLAVGWGQLDLTPDRFRLWRTILGFIPAAFLVAMLEELVFRGVVLQHLLPLSRGVAMIGSSVAYAVVHLKTLRMDVPTGLELVGLSLLGLVLAHSALATGRLFLPIGLHAALAYGARVNKLLIAFVDPTLWWLTGTSRLVNGLVGWAALAGLWALTTLRRPRYNTTSSVQQPTRRSA